MANSRRGEASAPHAAAKEGRRHAEAESPLELVLATIAKMRDPESGEPWAARQSMAGIVPYTIEESYEVAEAVDSGEAGSIRDEIGDLLLQVVFYAQIGQELGWFDFDQVAAGLHAKLRRRYYSRMPGAGGGPGKSGDESGAAGSETGAAREGGLLSGVSHAMPAVRRAEKLQKKAAAVGFDWPGAKDVLGKALEELGELRHEVEEGDVPAAREELGDVLFVCVNLARHLGTDAETVLRAANRKFEGRFASMERQLAASGLSLEEAGLERMERAWQQAKEEAEGGGS